MQLPFEPALDFQLLPIETAHDLFRNQEIYQSEFNVTQALALVVSCGHIERMITMGIRKLKSRLSKCFRMVREGNEVHVTHRGESVSETRPPTRLPNHNIDNELRRRARTGKVRLGAQNRPDVYIGTSVQLPEDIAQTLLNESRNEY